MFVYYHAHLIETLKWFRRGFFFFLIQRGQYFGGSDKGQWNIPFLFFPSSFAFTILTPTPAYFMTEWQK